MLMHRNHFCRIANIAVGHIGNMHQSVFFNSYIHDLTVWPDELRAERAGVEIELTPREAAMLALLHECAGRPVTRDTFLDRCWDIEYFPDSRTLDQHIAMLRKKIERDPAEPQIIETVRGVGYRYRPQGGI